VLPLLPGAHHFGDDLALKAQRWAIIRMAFQAALTYLLMERKTDEHRFRL